MIRPFALLRVAAAVVAGASIVTVGVVLGVVAEAARTCPDWFDVFGDSE